MKNPGERFTKEFSNSLNIFTDLRFLQSMKTLFSKFAIAPFQVFTFISMLSRPEPLNAAHLSPKLSTALPEKSKLLSDSQPANISLEMVTVPIAVL